MVDLSDEAAHLKVELEAAAAAMISAGEPPLRGVSAGELPPLGVSTGDPPLPLGVSTGELEAGDLGDVEAQEDAESMLMELLASRQFARALSCMKRLRYKQAASFPNVFFVQ